MTLTFHSVQGVRVAQAHAELAAGAHVVLGSDGAALDELVALACGELWPRRGAVLVDGAPVAFAPRARRRVGAVRAVETLPPAKSLVRALGEVLSARGLSLTVEQLLSDWDLEALGERRPSDLGGAELRSVSLALALADEQATLLALYEPLATGLDRERVLESLRKRAGASLILGATSSLDDARSLGGTWYVLDGGILSPSNPAAFALAGGTNKTLLVRSRDARKLAALLSEEPAVSAVNWDERRSRAELSVSGFDAAKVGLALTRTALEHGLALDAVTPLVPPLEAVLAARAGLLRSAYESAAARSAQPAVFAAPPYPGAPAALDYQSPSAPTPSAQSVGLGEHPASDAPAAPPTTNEPKS